MAREIELKNIGAGHLGNGLVVWDRTWIEAGDYKKIAHINHDRSIKYYVANLPCEVIKYIEELSRSNLSASYSQTHMKVFY